MEEIHLGLREIIQGVHEKGCIKRALHYLHNTIKVYLTHFPKTALHSNVLPKGCTVVYIIHKNHLKTKQFTILTSVQQDRASLMSVS